MSAISRSKQFSISTVSADLDVVATECGKMSITDTFEPIKNDLQIGENTYHVSIISIKLSVRKLNKNSPTPTRPHCTIMCTYSFLRRRHHYYYKHLYCLPIGADPWVLLGMSELDFQQLAIDFACSITTTSLDRFLFLLPKFKASNWWTFLSIISVAHF